MFIEPKFNTRIDNLLLLLLWMQISTGKQNTVFFWCKAYPPGKYLAEIVVVFKAYRPCNGCDFRTVGPQCFFGGKNPIVRNKIAEIDSGLLFEQGGEVIFIQMHKI